MCMVIYIPYYRIKKSSSESNFIIGIVQRDVALKASLGVVVKTGHLSLILSFIKIKHLVWM